MKRTLAKIEDETATLEANTEGVLSARQEQALEAVISHPTLKEAALTCGISETTLWRYMQEEAFNRRLREARRDAINYAVIRLQRASGIDGLINTAEAGAEAAEQKRLERLRDAEDAEGAQRVELHHAVRKSSCLAAR